MFDSISYRKFDSQRKFGVEMEMNKAVSKKKLGKLLENISSHRVLVTPYSLSTNNNYWHIKDDATCGDYGTGIEIASFIAQGYKDLDHISSIADLLETIGCRTNNYCGLHIHADASDLKEEQVGVLLGYWFKIENVIAAALPKHRRNNEYCKPLSRLRGILTDDIAKIQWSGRDLWYLYKPENPHVYYGNDNRRVNFNLVNYARAVHLKKKVRKTLELRWPEGTLSGLNIRGWVRLFLGFIDNCKDKEMPKNLFPCDIEEAISLLGFSHNGNTFNILSEGLYETKEWFMERIIKNSPQTQFASQAKYILQKMK